ncbi:menaquinone biosynthesis decarboxylase [Thermoflexus sp.]|uniref:menaquinone biosynthesis decarboxylase n=1 Tax=Thermoflexus sp. TaxID=1969742 RepID=UPI001772FED6|nr:menaquinone biosynthesis decarboxylase [Thermoflexus sp.]
MAYQDLRDFLNRLEQAGELVRIRAPVSAELEITEIADRVMKGPPARNKALLFENVDGKGIPVAINLFGTRQRMAWALGVEDLEELRKRLETLLRPELPQSLGEAFERLGQVLGTLRSIGLGPRRVSRAPCQEVVETERPSLDRLPILKCWPKDAGRYITLGQVITRDPRTGKRNVGLYRLQVHDERTLGVHWQIHKGGAEHERAAREAGAERIPIAVALGGDPACIWAASAPLPPDIDEYLLAGWLRGRPVEMVPCVTQPLEVPAHAEIIIEGYIDPWEQRMEGPFGDHTGYYTPPEPFPVMHITAITHRRDPIYPTTIVGRPPMEDYWMGKATERLFLPLIRLFLPEVVDYNMPAEGVFHNLVIVSIRKRFPGHARKVIFGLWGLGLLSLAKCIVVVDSWVDVHNLSEVAWQALGNVDWKRDVVIVEGPVDHLDHAAPLRAYGGKIGIDATAKGPEEGHPRGWPERIEMSPEIRALVNRRWEEYGLP